MNSKLFAWMLAGCCGLFGAGYLASHYPEQASASKNSGPPAEKLLAGRDSLNPPAFRGGMALPQYSLSGEQLVRHALDSTDAQQQDDNLKTSLTDWTSKSPLDAARFVQDMPTGILRDKALRILAQTWGEHEADAALNWSDALSDQSEHEMFLTNVCLGLAEKNPEAAVDMACLNHDHEAGLIENLAQQWAEKEAPSALAWAIQQPTGEGRDKLLQRIALVESKTDPAEAAKLVVQQMQPGPAQSEAVLTVVHQWGERDWNGAAAWVEQFPAGVIRDRATTELNGIPQD